MDDIRHVVAKNTRYIRRVKEMTQVELAALLREQTGDQTWKAVKMSQWEHPSEKRIGAYPIKDIQDVANALGVPITALLKERSDDHPW